MALIEIRQLEKTYDGNRVLGGVNLDIAKGSTTVILGKSGAGKSVLLKAVIGLVVPDAGSIMIDERDLLAMNRRELNAMRRTMGYLFQGAALYDSMSVRENLGFTLDRRERLAAAEREERIATQLRLVGLLDTIDKMPSDLSGGMRKRVGLARSLIINPDIMLYDEPTTGLDPITSREISFLIKSLQERSQPTSIAVTHDMECARIIADRAAVLNEGVISQQGSFADLERSADAVVQGFFASKEDPL